MNTPYVLVVGNATEDADLVAHITLAAESCGEQVQCLSDISDHVLPALHRAPHMIVLLPSTHTIPAWRRLKAADSTPCVWVTGSETPQRLPPGWPDTTVLIRRQDRQTLRTCIRTLLSMTQRQESLHQEKVALESRLDGLLSQIGEQERIEQELRGSLTRAQRARRALLSVIEDHKRVADRLSRDEARLRTVLTVLQSDVSSEEELLQKALAETVRLTESQFGCIGLMDLEQGGIGQIIRVDSPSTPPVTVVTGQSAVTMVHEALRQGHAVLVNDAESQSHACTDNAQITRYIAAPVSSHGQVAAVACIANRAEAYDDTDVLLLTLMLDTVWRLVETRRHEAALRRSESMYRAITENAFDLIALLDQEGHIVYANASFNDILGYQVSQVHGVNALDYVHHADQPDVMRWFEDLVHHVVQSAQFRVRIWDASQQIHWLDCRAALIDADIGTAVPLMVMARDVTSHMHAEEERERLMLAIEQAAEMVVITSARGIIEYVNPAYETISGHTSEEVIGCSVRSLNGHSDPATVHDVLATIRSGQAWRGTVRCQRTDRRPYVVEATVSPVRGADGAITNYVLVGHDVTEREQMQRQISQSQRMEAIGRLAGGVAHDFNNMLSVIQGFSELALDHLQSPDDIEADLAEIGNACERASQITRQLLSFAKQSSREPQVLDLNATLEGMLKMLRRLIGEDIKLEWRPSPDLWPVLIDPSHVDQLLANLCVNARDAIHDVGVIEILTRNVTYDDGWVMQNPHYRAGEYVSIAVRDSGHGMDTETLEHLFEPFYTTREEAERGWAWRLCMASWNRTKGLSW